MPRCRTPTADVAVLNQELARRLWPGESPIDRRIGFRYNDDISWLRVVGVVPNVHYEEVGEDTDQSRLNVYVPYATTGSRQMAMLVRAQGAPEGLIAPLREALRRIGPTFAVFGLRTMTDMRKGTTWEQEFFGDIMAAFAAGALLLACLGIYALISYSVGRRSREIGVRLALGARPADVIRMLLRQTARVGGAGLLVGLIARRRRRARAGRRPLRRQRQSVAVRVDGGAADGGAAAGDVAAGAPRRPRRADDRAAGRVDQGSGAWDYCDLGRWVLGLARRLRARSISART